MTKTKFTKEAIINFFDPLAEGWDDHKKPDFAKGNFLLDNAAVTEEKLFWMSLVEPVFWLRF